MILFIISIAWFIFIVHFLWHIAKIYFTREILDPRTSQNLLQPPLITVIIPARNEESNIEKCVLSLLSQTYPSEKLEIIIVDDNSSDNTASIVKRIMNEHENLTLLSAGILPKGWGGKNHACWQGTKRAEGNWYCFIDADTQSAPELLVPKTGKF